MRPPTNTMNLINAATNGIPLPAMLQRGQVLGGVNARSIRVESLNAKLKAPFPIASDRSKKGAIKNALIVADDYEGHVGLGEAAPFRGIAGDTHEALLRDMALHSSSFSLVRWGDLVSMDEPLPAARAALEMAHLDMLSRVHGEGLYKFLNPEAEAQAFETDITIPLVGSQRAEALARDYLQRGFGRVKVKVGDDAELSEARVAAVHDIFKKGGVRFDILIDANEGFSAEQSTGLLDALARRDIPVKIFEQPVERGDLDGMALVRERAHELGALVFADESVFTVADAIKAIEAGATDGINLKLMKHGGFVEALRIAELAQKAGLRLMVGGMVETRLAMSAGLHLALAIGDVSWIDLDTPLLLEEELFEGGLRYDGPMVIPPEGPGIGVKLKVGTELV